MSVNTAEVSSLAERINWDKVDGLVPAIVQDFQSSQVLMMGYMNQDALAKTGETGQVTFFSRTKQRLWTKGEESKNDLDVLDISVDCDQDAILIQAKPHGPTCHKGNESRFNDQQAPDLTFLSQLEKVIEDRKNNPSDKSYTSSLFQKGINKVAQKVGEEAVEVVIEAKDNNRDLFVNEAADLLYHYLILLQAKDESLASITEVLKARHN